MNFVDNCIAESNEAVTYHSHDPNIALGIIVRVLIATDSARSGNTEHTTQPVKPLHYTT